MSSGANSKAAESEGERTESAPECETVGEMRSGSASSEVYPTQETTADGDSQAVYDSSRYPIITGPSQLQQSMPLPIPKADGRSRPSSRPQVFSPTATDHDQLPEAANVTCVSMFFGEARHCPINIGPQSRQGASAGESQCDVTQVSPFSSKFGNVKTRIKQAIRREGKEEELLDCATELSGPNPRDRLFPEAGKAQTIDDFFRLGSSYEWWNWLDYDRLFLLLDICKCEQAQEILRQYSSHLSTRVTQRLGEMNANPPMNRQHWLEMKCPCDHCSLDIKAVYNHKTFLMNRLQVPREAFTFCDHYEGCVTTIWKVHSPVQAEAIKQRILTFDGAKLQKTEHATVVSAPCACDLPSVLFDLVRSNSLNVNGCSIEDLCAKTQLGETLLMAAVRKNNPTLLKDMLDKNLPREIKDFRENELKQTAATLAASLNYCKCLQVLLSYDCHPALPDVTGRVPLHYACANNCAVCVRRITQSDSGLKHLQWTTNFLSTACVSDNVVQAITLAKKRRQHKIVAPALFKAATSGNFAHAKDVLEEGDDLDVKNMNGVRAAYVAACSGHLGVLKELEDRGSKVVCFTEDRSTILHGAAMSGQTDVTEHVLQCMALEEAQFASAKVPSGPAPWDVNARNSKGESALEIAALNGYMEVIKLMVSRGVSPYVPASSGHLVSSPYEGVQHALDAIKRRHVHKLETAIKERHTLAEFQKSWQTPYDYNMRTTQGYSMIVLAAEYGRHDVLQYLLDSLSKTFEGDSRVNILIEQEVQATRVCDRAQSSCGKDEGYSEGTYLTDNAQHRPMLLKRGHSRGYHSSDPVGGFCDPDLKSTNLTTMEQPSSLKGYLLKNVLPDGSTAAHRAAVANVPRNLATLLERCPTLANAQDSSGNTPSHLAVRWNNRACIKVLMDRNRETNFAIRNRSEHFPDEVFQNAGGSTRRKMMQLREKHVQQFGVVRLTRECFREIEPYYMQCAPRSCSRAALSPVFSDSDSCEQSIASCPRGRLPLTR